jgi:hypothetical protein
LWLLGAQECEVVAFDDGRDVADPGQFFFGKRSDVNQFFGAGVGPYSWDFFADRPWLRFGDFSSDLEVLEDCVDLGD